MFHVNAQNTHIWNILSAAFISKGFSKKTIGLGIWIISLTLLRPEATVVRINILIQSYPSILEGDDIEHFSLILGW